MRKGLKQLGIITVTMSLLLTGCGNGGKNSNDSNLDSASLDSGSELFSGTEESQAKKGDIWPEASIDDFSGDWEAEEEYGYSPFWLKYANLSALEEKDLSTVMFYDTIPFGTDLGEFILYGDYYELVDSDENVLFGGNEVGEFSIYLDDITMVPGSSAVIYQHLETEDDPNKNIKIVLYNFTDSDVSVDHCTFYNDFYMDFSGGFHANEMIGVDFEESEFRTGMAEVMRILGRPTKVLCVDSDLANTDREGEKESFIDTLQKGGGTITYELIYEQEEYILCLKVTESNSMGNYYGIGSFTYLTSEVYEELQKEDGCEVYEFE